MNFLYYILLTTNAIIDFITINAELIKIHLPPIMRILIPLSFTIYFFTYKERKEITYSYLRSKKFPKKALSLLLITISILILLYFNFLYKPSSLIFDLLLLLLTIIWFIFLLLVYLYLFRTINIFNVFEDHLSQIKRANYELSYLLKFQNETSQSFYENEHSESKFLLRFWELKDKFLQKRIKKLLNTIDTGVQVTSQILISKIKYNLPKDLSRSLKTLIDELESFIQVTTKHNTQHLAALQCLSLYSEVYYGVLRNIELLTEYASKNGKNHDLEKIITFLKNATVGPYLFGEEFNVLYLSSGKIRVKFLLRDLNEMQHSYIKTIKSVTTTLSNTNHWDDLTLLRNLNHLSEESSSSTGSFSEREVNSIYTAFVIEAVNENNIKLLTDTVNLFLQKKQSYKSVIILLLLSAIKSIELAHYQCAGFLVKMIVKNTSAEKLREYTNLIHINMTYKKSFSGNEFVMLCEEIDKKLIEDLMLTIPFSPISFSYCYSKLIYILILQQKLILKDNPNILIYEEFNFETNKDYVYKKILNLHKEYGLIALNSNTFDSSQNFINS